MTQLTTVSDAEAAAHRGREEIAAHRGGRRGPSEAPPTWRWPAAAPRGARTSCCPAWSATGRACSCGTATSAAWPPRTPTAITAWSSESLLAALAARGAQPPRSSTASRASSDPTRRRAPTREELRGRVPAGDDGLPVLDLALLGLGEDGHTASLFPGHPELRRPATRLCLPVHGAPKPPPERVTLEPRTCCVRRAVRAARHRGEQGGGAGGRARRPRPATCRPACCARDALHVIADEAARRPGRERERRSQLRSVLVRHAETEWSRSGRHTGRTDIPLTERGREVARRLAPAAARVATSRSCSRSPLGRARETCELAGLAGREQVRDELLEWDYGDYEGLHHARDPRASARTGTCGATAARTGRGRRRGRSARRPRDRRAARARGDVAAVRPRARAARAGRALGASCHAEAGALFALSTGSICVLGYERETRVSEALERHARGGRGVTGRATWKDAGGARPRTS